MTYQQVIDFVASKVRYKTLSPFIGLQIPVFAVATLERDIRNAVDSLLPVDAVWDSREVRFVTGAMAKYGLIDAQFTVSPSMLQHDYQQGKLLLQALHFDIAELLDPAVDIEESLTYSALEMMYEELSSSKAWLKLFLRAEAHGDAKLSLPVDYLPRTFVIEDACIANSTYLWVFKHFYF
ncbi:MAG: hypothetical protein KF716_30000 [Anaerolineae bacterium]|nr:hypothetical protein [Anaerolineae bacterium]